MIFKEIQHGIFLLKISRHCEGRSNLYLCNNEEITSLRS